MKNLRYALFTFLILGLVLRAVALQDTTFYDWDEGIYAEVSSELVETNGIQTTFNGQVWFNKPPLSHFMISWAFRLIQDPELGARLVMVIFASLMLVMTYKLSKQLTLNFFKKKLESMSGWESELVYFIPVFVTASAPIFIERSTQLNTDIMLGVFWLGYFLSMQSYPLRLIYITLGSWAKSLLGLYPLGFEVLKLSKSSFTKKGLLKGLGLVLIPLSWQILNYAIYKDYFIKSHLMDQLVKRVTDPIELHYGGKLFYFELAWENFSIILVAMAVAYLVVAWDAWKKYRSPIRIWKSENWETYLALFSALPFFFFLSLVQSKITWYFATVLPLFTLVLPYAYIKISMAKIRQVLLVALIGYFSYMFVPQTYAFNPPEDTRSDLVKLAQCLAELPNDSVSLLVNAQERQNRNVLEAAQQQTETSFIYGGSPSFVYYTGKKVDYHYRPEEFSEILGDASLIAFSQEDRHNSEYTDIFSKVDEHAYKPVNQCFIGEWEVYIK